MKAIAGVFKSKENAGRAVAELRTLGITNDRISLLTPGSTQQELNAVPTLTAEKPGMAKALGAVVGGTVGLAGGWEIGTVLAGALIPGVGPVVAAGLLGGAIVAALGAVGGGAAAGAMDASLSAGLPEDELFVYEDALRQGRSVVIALPDPAQSDAARGALEHNGAESIDKAREMMWVGARDVEKEHYIESGGDFEREEPEYRAGFEAALHVANRDKGYEECLAQLRVSHPEYHDKAAFKHGFARGQNYRKERLKAIKAVANKTA
jgi:hypothetical protein